MRDAFEQDLGLYVAIQIRSRLYREVIAALIDREPDIRVVGATAIPAEIPRLCALRDPDVVVLEVEQSPGEPQRVRDDLPALVAELRLSRPGLHIVGLYDQLQAGMAEWLFRKGISRLVAGASGAQALLSAVRQPMWRDVRDINVRDQRQAGRLTEDELQILRLIGSGYTLEQIASALEVSPRRVENHKRRIFAKLDARSQAHATAYAVRYGLLRPGPSPAADGARRSGQPPVAWLRGSGGALADEVAVLLLRNGVPLIFDPSRVPAGTDHPARHTRGVLVAVLVDPEAADWPAPGGLATRTIVVTSQQPCQAAMAEVVLRGADALVTAPHLATALAPAFELVTTGYALFDAVQARTFIAAGCARLASTNPFVPLELTVRERQILKSIERGHSVRQTARALGISLKTVESLQSRLFRKLGIHSRSEALVVAHGFGLLPLEPEPGVAGK